MSIILIGYRGSGKTTLGRRLADELRWPFVDLDERIVEAAGRTIKQIFEESGESAFRELESQHLAEVVVLKDHVISLGGGAILAEKNRRLVVGSGHPVVYLKAEPEELHRRIVADPATAAQRPGLTYLGGSVEEVRALLARREALYQEVKTVELDAAGSTDALVEQLKSHMKQGWLKKFF
jgi:shikimate kinase